MKILLTSGSGIYDKSFPETRKNQSGFGIMIRALADMLQKNGDDVDIITGSNITPGRKIGHAVLVRKKWYDLLFHTKFFYLKKVFQLNRAKGLSLSKKMKNVLYFMTASYAEHLMRKNKYDVVHINGFSFGSIAYMYACIRTDTPFIITLHGLNSFNPDIKAPPFIKNMERVFFTETKGNERMLSTVISTGIKRRLNNVVGQEIDTMSVVCNPVINSSEAGFVPYEKAEGEKVILTVGNISKNKNQRLVVDAFARMTELHGEGYKLFVIGGGESELKEYAESQKIKNVVFTGALDKTVVNEYYKIADLCVMASIDEGFGLSLVEGYSYGVPAVMPTAIDAYYDLYEEYACASAESYDVTDFASTMHSALTKEWDSEKIKKKAELFTEEICAEGYLSALRLCAQIGSPSLDKKALDKIVALSLNGGVKS